MTAPNTLPRREAYRLGAGLTLAAVGFLLWPVNEPLSSPGPLMRGHTDAARCADCHTPAGGNRPGFLHHPVGNDSCLACHAASFDVHAGHRFNAPTFAAAREAIAPQNCVSCHREHTGRRVSGVAAGFCAHCHQGMSVVDDPIRPTHAESAAGDWSSCLRCHDYHGNHRRATPRVVPVDVPAERVLEYFRGGPSPYGDPANPGKKKAHGNNGSGAPQ